MFPFVLLFFTIVGYIIFKLSRQVSFILESVDNRSLIIRESNITPRSNQTNMISVGLTQRQTSTEDPILRSRCVKDFKALSKDLSFGSVTELLLKYTGTFEFIGFLNCLLVQYVKENDYGSIKLGRVDGFKSYCCRII